MIDWVFLVAVVGLLLFKTLKIWRVFCWAFCWSLQCFILALSLPTKTPPQLLFLLH